MKWSIFSAVNSLERPQQHEGQWKDFCSVLENPPRVAAKVDSPLIKLATFGATPTTAGCYRCDANMLSISGIEADYDAGLMQPEAVVAKLERYLLKAAVTTTLSHAPDKPRWRVFCPLSKEHPPEARYGLVARLNGILGGVLAPESFTLSQGWYYGQIGEFTAEKTFAGNDDGHFIDTCEHLEDIAIGRHSWKHVCPDTGEIAVATAMEFSTFGGVTEHLGRKLRKGDGRRDMLASFVGRLAARGGSAESITAEVETVAREYFDAATPVDWPNITKLINDITSKQTAKPKPKALKEAQRVIEDAKARASAAAETQPPPPTRFTLLQREGILALPPLTWRIHGLLPSTGVGLLYGPWGSAKSLLTLDLSAALAGTADSWFGLPIVEHCPAVICAFEGQAGYRNRVRAWESHHRCELPLNVMFATPADFSLLHEKDTLELAATIRKSAPGAVVFLDTLAQGAPGLNENDSSQVGVVLHNLQRMAQIVGGLVIAVHHTGKDVARGPRGYSSMEPAADVVICLDKTEGLRNWKATKIKEGEAIGEKLFRLAQIDLGLDGYGQPISSVCIAGEEPGASFGTPKRYPSGANQRIAFDAIGDVLRASTQFGMADAPSYRPCVKLDVAIAAAAQRIPKEEQRYRTQSAKRAIEDMVARGVLAAGGGWIWIP